MRVKRYSIMSTNEYQMPSQERRNICDREQYEILKGCSAKRSITEWNIYRSEHPDTKINLQNADLREVNFSDARGLLQSARNGRPVGHKIGSPWLHVASKLLADWRWVKQATAR